MRRLLLGLLVGAALVCAPSTRLTAGASGDGVSAPPQHLRDTGLGRLGRPFTPQYPLWTDGAAKNRWVYLPDAAAIDARDETEWDFPVGTRFWKEFSFKGRKAETRMLWKAAPDRWVAASYVWNESGSDAVLAPAEGMITDAEVASGKRHIVPSREECLMCHGTRKTGPLGFTALQLSPDRDPNAIHGERVGADNVTLETLVRGGHLAHARTDLLARPPRIRTSDPAARAVLGYLAANCGSCHNGRGEIAALGPVLRVADLLHDGDEVARSFIGQTTHWQVPGVAEGASVLLDPGVPDQSALLVRMRSRRPSSQMPPLGTVVRDEQAVSAITQWVNAQVERSH